MKVAIVHDYIKEYGGAERVLETLHEIYPDARVFTSVYLPEFLGPHRERFKNWDIRTSWFQRIPLNAKLISPFRIIAPFVFSQFDFSKFDVVIVSSTGAYVKKFKIPHFTIPLRQDFEGQEVSRGRQKSKIKVIVYCHTPPRYLYGYATAREWRKNIIFRILGSVANHFLRLIDFKSAQNVDYFIANSKEVESRIKKFYRREATVVYPPVNTIDDRKSKIENSNLKIESRSLINSQSSTFKNQSSTFYHLSSKSYFLAGGRLARAKHTDLIIEACGRLSLPLKVFGKGFANTNIKYQIKNKKSKIEYLGEVSDEEKYELMKNAKAYIFASEDEDFGITPVEAMSVGTPVIAYRSGGVKETVIDGKTGIFFDELTVEGLSKAIEQFNNAIINSKDCIHQARKFSKERFRDEIENFVNAKCKDNIEYRKNS